MPFTYKKIASVTVGSGGASDIDFQNIPQTYTDLVIKLSSRMSTTSGENQNVQFQFNGSSANRSARELYGTGSAAGSVSLTEMRFGYTSSINATANTFGNAEIYIPNYTSANNKSSSGDGVAEGNITGMFMAMEANLWSQTAAITRITIVTSGATFQNYSTATLYGISKS